MAVNFISIKCPECGANLEIEQDREMMFCSYCGRKIMMVDENRYEVVHRHIDDAEIMRVKTKHTEKEAEQAYKLKLLEIENRKDRRRQIGWWILYGIIFALLLSSIIGFLLGDEFILLGLFGFMGFLVMTIVVFEAKTSENEKQRDNKNTSSGKIRLTDKAMHYDGEDYLKMRAIYYELGFNDVRLINAHDLTFGIFNKPGSVYEITINRESLSNSKWYDPDAKVRIKYHDYADQD